MTLLVILFLALQTTPAQRFISKKVESYLQQTLDTDLGIGRIGWQFPSSVFARDVYLNTPPGDTLLRLGNLAVDLNMWELFNRNVAIEGVRVDQLYGRFLTTDSSSNYAFLLDAFTPADSAAVAVDTTAGAAPWTITLDDTDLSLNQIDFIYQDDPQGIRADVELATLRAQSRRIDLDNGLFDLREILLQDSDLFIHLSEGEPTEPTEPTVFKLNSDQLRIESTRYRMAMDSLEIDSYIGSTELTEATAEIGETIVFQAPEFRLSDGRFALDLPAPPVSEGIDYNHLDLEDIQIELADISYRNDSVALVIDTLSAREESGLVLRRTNGRVVYHPTGIYLEDFLLETSRSLLRGPAVRVDYAFAESPPLEELEVDVDAIGYLGIGDILLLAPQLAEQPILSSNRRERIEFSVRATGDGRQLTIDQANVDGPGLVLRASGEVAYPFDTARLAGSLRLYELAALPRPLVALLPDGTVPDYIEWPERITGAGTFSYRNQELTLNFRAAENRDASPLTSRLDLSGTVRRPAGFPNTYLDLRLDTLVGTRPTFLAYLPPGSLPDGFTLPAFVRAEGTVVGPMENLRVDLRFALPQRTTYADIEGQIENILDPDQLRLDLQISDLGVAQADVRALVPDSLLPAQIRLPDLRIRNASVEGSLDDLSFDVPLESSNGDWQISGRYNPRDLDIDVAIENLRAAEFFTGALGDSLASLDLNPIRVSMQIEGQLEPTLAIDARGTLTETGRGELLDFTASAKGDTYLADFSFDHVDLAGTGQAQYTLVDSVAVAEARLDLRRIDLQRWELSEKPLSASGSLEFNTIGLELDNLESTLSLDDIYLRGEEATAYIDSLVARASLQNGDNEIRIRSDVLDANLTGQFQPVSVTMEFIRFLRGYWNEAIDQPDPVVYGNRVDFDLNVKNPRPLTSGLIPGLEEASPLTVEFLYREESPEFLLDVRLPHLVYGGITFDSLAIDATGGTEDLVFDATWADIILSEQARIGRTRITGGNRNNGLALELTVRTAEDSIRHRLTALTDLGSDSISVVMAPEQVLNFETWRVPEDNLILLDSSSLIVNNWALRNGNQLLLAETTAPNDLRIAFEDFELSFIGRVINTEEDLIGGQLNGEVFLDEVLSDLGIRSDVVVRELSYLGQPMGTLTAEVSSSNNVNFTVDAGLEGSGNQVAVSGTYREGGLLDLELNLDQLQLASAEPFSLGYLQQTAGYLAGQVSIDGSLNDPELRGQLRFQDAALAISLLGSRYYIGEQPILLAGDRILFDDFTILDSLDNRAVMNGNVLIRSISDYAFDLDVRARNFLVLNSTAAENELYYGYLLVDADVDIGGDVYRPEIYVTASPRGDSRLTYDYAVGLAQQEAFGISEQNVVRFVERFEWQEILRTGRQDTVITAEATGTYIQTNLNVNDNLLIRVIIDPVTDQEFSGRGEGDISFTQFADGRQEITGQVEMIEGTYDLVLEGIQPYEFQIDPGSRVYFTGSVENPQLDLAISTQVKTSPLPLVQKFQPESTLSGLRQRETFIVELNLDGDLQAMKIDADIRYPEDEYGNAGFTSVTDALNALRRDESQMYTTAFTLITFRGFVIPLTGGDTGNPDAIKNGVAGAVAGALNNLVNQNLGFVELDFGVENYQTAAGEDNYNLRVSLSKSFLNNRLIVNVDGVTNTATDETTGDAQTYLDNISVEYLLNESGNLRIKLFNDRDRNIFVGGNVLRFGGRLVFSKDFNQIRWFGKKEEAPEPVRSNDDTNESPE